jgi:hypothetical protein
MSPFTAAHPAAPAAVRDTLWAAVRDGDEYAATGTVLHAPDAGPGAEETLLDVEAPVRARAGTEWAANRMSVTREHAAIAVSGRAVAAVARRVGAAGPEAPTGLPAGFPRGCRMLDAAEVALETRLSEESGPPGTGGSPTAGVRQPAGAPVGHDHARTGPGSGA